MLCLQYGGKNLVDALKKNIRIGDEGDLRILRARTCNPDNRVRVNDGLERQNLARSEADCAELEDNEL